MKLYPGPSWTEVERMQAYFAPPPFEELEPANTGVLFDRALLGKDPGLRCLARPQ